jgi:hypothetical protein
VELRSTQVLAKLALGEASLQQVCPKGTLVELRSTQVLAKLALGAFACAHLC